MLVEGIQLTTPSNPLGDSIVHQSLFWWIVLGLRK